MMPGIVAPKLPIRIAGIQFLMAPFFAADVVHDAQKQFQSKTDLRTQIVVRVTGKKTSAMSMIDAEG
jgi:hypothetical protein